MNIKKTFATTVIVIASSQFAAHATTIKSTIGMEKCYGIVKAGMNDCDTSTTSCAGSATKDAQSDAYLLLPKGSCQKIVGGSLASKKPSVKEKT